MRLLHAASRTHARFDDPDLIACAGLVPVMRLGDRAGLPRLVAEHLRPADPKGVNAEAKVGCLVAGMLAGADSIEDMEVLRHGAVGNLFAGVRAPSTLGTFLRALDWGNVRQLGKVYTRRNSSTTRDPGERRTTSNSVEKLRPKSNSSCRFCATTR